MPLRELLARAVAEDNHQRYASVKALHDCGKRIATPGPLRHHRHADFAGAARVTVGDIHRRLFVAREDQRHLAVFMKRIEDRQNVIAGQSRHELHAFGSKNIDDSIGYTPLSGFLSI